MFGKPIAKTNGADYQAVGSASAQLKDDMEGTKVYQFCSSTNCFFKQGYGSQTASAAADNIFAPAGAVFYLHGGNGTHISVIRDTADGKATIHEIQEI